MNSTLWAKPKYTSFLTINAHISPAVSFRMGEESGYLLSLNMTTPSLPSRHCQYLLLGPRTPFLLLFCQYCLYFTPLPSISKNSSFLFLISPPPHLFFTYFTSKMKSTDSLTARGKRGRGEELFPHRASVPFHYNPFIISLPFCFLLLHLMFYLFSLLFSFSSSLHFFGSPYYYKY